MKKLVFLFAAVSVLSFMSCNKEDKCTRADWLGTYEEATRKCEGQDERKYTIKIEKGDKANEIVIDNLIFTVDGCKATISGEEGGVSLNGTLTLDGKKISGSITTKQGTQSNTCTLSASKK